MPTNARLEGRTEASGTAEGSARIVSDRSLVARNYDGTEAHELRVRFLDSNGEVAFARSFTLPPLETGNGTVSVVEGIL